MKTMKKVMAGLGVLAMSVGVISAQNPNLSKSATGVRQEARPAPGNLKHKTPDEWVAELDQVVGLNADQKTQAKALAEQTEIKMKALRQEAVADKAVLKEKRMQIHKEQKAGLDKILNDEQKAKWKAHRQAQFEARGGQAPHKSPDQVVADLDAIVGLSADQKAQVKTLAETKAAKMKALREEQKANPNEEVFRQKRQEIGKEYRAGLDKILTADQKAKLKAAIEAKKAEHGAPNR